MNNVAKRIIQKAAVCLGCLGLLAGAAPMAFAAAAKPVAIAEGYTRVAQTAGAAMWADTTTGLFAVENTATGTVWHSTPQHPDEDDRTIGSLRTELQSQVVIQYVFKEDEISTQAVKIANSRVDCVMSGHIQTEVLDNGLRVVYDFADIGIRIPVEYRLRDAYLEADVLWEKIVVEDTAYLMSIQLLPAFGANDGTAQGYLLVPDGSGALIHFNNNIDSDSYESMIYGRELAQRVTMQHTQTETVRMPVYGINRGNDALFAIVTEGDSSATIVAHNRNSTCGYDAISSRRIVRQLTKKTIYENDAANRRDISRVTIADDIAGYTVRYYFLSGEQADYVGMAALYRQYLCDEQGLKKSVSTPTFALDIYGAIDRTASFLGIPYTKTEKLTTFSQAEEMLRALKDAGIEEITVRYCGWTGGGMLNRRLLTKAKPLWKLGGKKGLSQLTAYLQSEETELYLDIDPLRYRKGSSKSAIRTAFEQIAEQYIYLRSVYARNRQLDSILLLSLDRLQTSMTSVLKSLQPLEQKNLSLGTLGGYVYSNFSADVMLSRSAAGQAVAAGLQQAVEAGHAVAADSGNAFVLPYVERLYDVPSSSSGYDIFDRDVPFYQIVLHGCITMTGPTFLQSTEPVDSFLKAVETGSELYYGGMYAPSDVLTGTRYEDLYSSTYTLWLEQAAQQYRAYMPVLEKIYDRAIIGHEQPAEGVSRTSFEGGCSVLVNYNSSDVQIAGQTVPAKSFVLMEGGDAR